LLSRRSRVLHIAVLSLVFAGTVAWAQAPQITSMQRVQARQMLRTIRDAIK